MEHDIRTKLETLLESGLKSEAEVVYLLVQVRKLHDITAVVSGYKSNRINWLEIEGCGSLESMS